MRLTGNLGDWGSQLSSAGASSDPHRCTASKCCWRGPASEGTCAGIMLPGCWQSHFFPSPATNHQYFLVETCWNQKSGCTSQQLHQFGTIHFDHAELTGYSQIPWRSLLVQPQPLHCGRLSKEFGAQTSSIFFTALVANTRNIDHIDHIDHIYIYIYIYINTCMHT